MVMPVKQNCPKCGRTFVGSDAIGDLCDSCKLEERGVSVHLCLMCEGRGFTYTIKEN